MERTRCTDLAEFKSEIQGQSSATEGTRGTRHAASVIGEDNETSTIYLKHNNFEDSRNGDRAFRSGDYVYIHTRKNEIYTKNLKLNVIFSETGDKKTIDKFNCILNCPSHIGSILRIEEGCEGVIDNGPPVVDIQVGDQLFPKSGIILCFRKEDGVYLISALLHIPDDCSCTVRMPGEDEMYTCPKERCACTTPNCFNLLLRYDKDILTLHQWRNFEEVKYESAPIKVVLLGKSGAGNSTLGNRLLQKELFPSTDSIESCTSECSSHVRFLPDGKTSLIVIDTPGLFSSKEKLDTTANKFIKLFKVSTQVNMFLLLVRVDVKFTEEELMTIKVIREIFGEEILDHTIVILENHGSIKKELKKVIDKAPPSLRDFIAACKDRCLLVNDLLSNKNEKEIDAILKLIKDTVSENGYNHYSCETYEYNIKKFNQKNEKTKQQKFSAPENEAFKCDNVKINYTTDKQMIPSKEKSRISHEHENKLRNNFTFISDNVRSSLKIVMDYLYEKGVLENDHVKRVTAKIDGGDERSAFRLFYDFIVEQGGPTAFVSFKECLEKYGFKTVVERLNSELDIVSNEQSENMTQLQYSSNKMTTAPVQHPATEKQPFCVKLHVAVKEKQSLDVMMVINPDSLHHKQIPSDKYSIDHETMQAQKVTDKYCHQTINNAQSTITTGNTSIRTQSLSNKTSTRLECHETTILQIESSQTPPEPILTNQESIQKSPTTYPNSHDSAIVLTNHKQSISCVTPEKSPVEKIDTNESHSEMRKSRKTTLEDTVYSNTRSENTQRLLSDRSDTDVDVRPKTVSYYETFQLNYSHNSMCKLRIIDRLKKKHKQVHISYFKDNDKVIQLVGNEASVKSAITCLNKYLNELKCDNLELTESKVKLLTKDDTRRMILCDSFEKKDDLVVWETASSNSDLRVISKETKWLEKARAILISFVEESHISVPDDAVHILTDQRWLSFVESVLKEYDDLVDISLTIEGCIYVTAVKNQLSNVKQSIDNFIDNFSQDSFFEKMISHGTVQDRFITMHLKKNLKVNIEQKPNKGILLQGTEKDVIEEEKRISNSISRLITRTKVVQAIFLDSPVGQKVVTNIEENHRCIVDILSKTKVPRQASFEMKNVRIYLVQVDMTRLPVDAIVYPTNSKLRLEGKLARCLTDTGGSSIAVQCEDFVRANGSVSVGGCVVLNSGFLPCKKIIHVVTPKWNETAKNECELDLQNALRQVLHTAVKNDCESLAIPTIGCGMFNFPTKTATEVIINTIVDFFNLWPKTPVIRHMYLVDVQPDPFDYYVRILKKNNGIRDVSNEDPEVISLETQNVSSRMSGEQKRKNIQLKIEFKDISKVEADVIVNSVSSNLNLSIGGVSSTLSGAEPLLQGECRSKYPNGIKEGHVAVTSGGQLKCKSIYHACLPSYENEESIKHLSEMITKCLEMAVKGEYSSIAFPALGTGMLCYPKKIVTSTFHQCINEFSFQSESINKFDIMIVLRPEEADSFKEYLKEVKRKDKAEKKTCHGRDKFVDVCFYSDDKFRLEGAVELFFAEYAKEIGN